MSKPIKEIKPLTGKQADTFVKAMLLKEAQCAKEFSPNKSLLETPNKKQNCSDNIQKGCGKEFKYNSYKWICGERMKGSNLKDISPWLCSECQEKMKTEETQKKEPIIKKYHSKDLNIAYNDGLEQGISEIKKKINEMLKDIKFTFANLDRYMDKKYPNVPEDHIINQLIGREQSLEELKAELEKL